MANEAWHEPAITSSKHPIAQAILDYRQDNPGIGEKVQRFSKVLYAFSDEPEERLTMALDILVVELTPQSMHPTQGYLYSHR